ncbi:putative succinyl-CoA ligase [Sesbania bispinosa]|nr:putative succinyl-CoA ligase [Sesbania bispinosa]
MTIICNIGKVIYGSKGRSMKAVRGSVIWLQQKRNGNKEEHNISYDVGSVVPKFGDVGWK